MNQPQSSGMSLSDDIDERHYGSSEEETREASSSSAAPKKRASRAGTRSVNSLTTAQLERKRQNDRDAQRAIRKRTKDHIETLERQVHELTTKSDTLERVNTALEAQARDAETRNRQLLQENEYLRSRLGNEGFMLRVPTTEAMGKPGTTAGNPAGQPSSDLRFVPHDMGRPSPQSANATMPMAPASFARKPDAWRQIGQTSPYESPETSAESSRRESVSGWKARGPSVPNTQDQLQAPHEASFQQRSLSVSAMSEQRPQWPKGAGYGYMVDMRGQPVAYGAEGKASSFPDSQPAGQFGVHMAMGPQQVSGRPQGYGADLAASPGEYANIPMQGHVQRGPGQEQMHGQQGYNIPMQQMAGATEYGHDAGDHRHDSLQRTSIPSSYTQGPPSAGFGQPGMEFQGDSNQGGYPYPQYRGQQ